MIRTILMILIIVLSVSQIISQTKDKQTLTLDQIISYALKNNPGLLADNKEIDITEKYVAIEKSRLLPSLSFVSDYSVSNQYNAPGKYQTSSAGIQAYLPIWQNGKIRTEVKKSQIGYNANLEAFKIQQANLVYLVNEAFINYLKSSKLTELSKSMVKRLSVTVEAATERLELGISKRSDLLKAQTEFSNALYLDIQLEKAKEKALSLLMQTSGLPLDSKIAINDSLVDYHHFLENVSIDSLYGLANNYLPEFQLISKQIEQQSLSVKIEHKNRFPEIAAYGSYNYLKSPVYDSNYFGTIGLSLKMDLFTGFRKKNQVAIEKIKSEQLNYEQIETNRLVYTEIQIAWQSLSEAREKINNAKMQVKSSLESFQMINQQYLNGLSSMLELIDAQYTDFRANQNYINAIADYYLAISLLKRKTGLLNYEYCTK
jgi:outer membrane protein